MRLCRGNGLFENAGAHRNRPGIGLVTMPGMSSMSSSLIVTDDAMGLTYLDTVTTSIGRIILHELDPDASMGPIIEDVTGQELGAH